MSQPLISIMMPVHNAAPWLEKSLRSILTQSYSRLELICVDDASEDESGAILDAWAARDSRIKVIHQPRGGVAHARNTALQHATGEWLTGVDPDDALCPGIYKEAVAHLSDDIDMLVFGTLRVNEQGDALPTSHQLYYRLPAQGVYPMTPEMGRTMSVCIWNKLWRRCIIEENDMRFPDGLLYEDEAFFRNFLPFVRSVYILPQIGYRYMMHTGSIVDVRDTGAKEKWARGILSVAQFVHRFYRDHGLLNSAYEHLMVFLWRSYLVFRYRGDDIEEGFRAMAQDCSRLPEAAGDRRVRRMLQPLGPKWLRFLVLDTELFREYRLWKFPLLRRYYSGKDGAGTCLTPSILLSEWRRRRALR